MRVTFSAIRTVVRALVAAGFLSVCSLGSVAQAARQTGSGGATTVPPLPPQPATGSATQGTASQGAGTQGTGTSAQATSSAQQGTPSAQQATPAAQQPASAPQQPTSAAQQPGQAGAPAAGAQDEQGPVGEGPTTLFTIQSNEVNLIFTVTDRKGHFITGLKRENFGLLDNGRPPASVVGFRQQTDLPLRVGVVIDTSSSIRTRFQFEQDSAVEFFLQIMHRNDRAFVEGFDVQTNLTQDYTNSIDALNQGIHKLRPGGGTAMYDALYRTCRDQMLTIRSTEAVRKALILVSDGDDNYSRAELSDAIKMCQRAETIVYTISTNLSPTRDRGDDVLKAVADATGGRAFEPGRIEDVANGFHSIEQELRSQYSLVYRPADFKADGSFRTIYLQALDSRYQVRTRKGYFAPRPQ